MYYNVELNLLVFPRSLLLVALLFLKYLVFLLQLLNKSLHKDPRQGLLMKKELDRESEALFDRCSIHSDCPLGSFFEPKSTNIQFTN